MRNIFGRIKLKCCMKYVELYQYTMQEVTKAILIFKFKEMGYCIPHVNYCLTSIFMEICISYSTIPPSPCLAYLTAFHGRLFLKRKFEKEILNLTYLAKLSFS